MLRPCRFWCNNETGPGQRAWNLFRAIRERDRDARHVVDLAERAPSGDSHRLEQTTSGIRGKCQNHAIRVVRRASRDRDVPAWPFANEAGHTLREAERTGELLG